MTECIMMVGPSYSGKSTVAKQLAQKYDAEIFASDDIREEIYGSADVQRNPQKVFQILHTRLKTALKEGRSVIYDATNLSAKRRIGFLKDLENAKIRCRTRAVVVVSSFKDIEARHKARERVVPMDSVRKQLRAFQCPYYYEGWDKIEIAYTSSYNDYVSCLDCAMFKCATLAHDNPHHSLNVGQHMAAAGRYAREHYPDIPGYVHTAIRYHDVGKLFTKSFTNYRGEPTEVAHFIGHQGYGAYLILMGGLQEDEEKLRASVLIQWHMEHYLRSKESMEKLEGMLEKSSLKDYLRILGECDMKAH